MSSPIVSASGPILGLLSQLHAPPEATTITVKVQLNIPIYTFYYGGDYPMIVTLRLIIAPGRY